MLYPRALQSEGFHADLRYTSRLSGLEQDIVCRTPLPDLPANWDPSVVLVEV